MAKGIKTRRGESKGVDDGATYLYNAGNEYSALTGGIIGISTFPSYSVQPPTKNSADIYISVSDLYELCGVFTNNAIDFSDFSKLKIEVTQFTRSSGVLQLAIYTDKTSGNVLSYVNKTSPISANTIIELDVSSINGSYYPSFLVFSGYCNATMTKMWLE